MVRTAMLLLFLGFIMPNVILAGPMMIITDPKLTLGEPILEGGVARGEFVIANQGDTELDIQSVTPG